MAFGIDIDFNAQVGKLSNQIDKISSDLGRFEKKAEQVTSKINSSFQTLGAGLSVAAFTSFVKNGIDAADALNDLSDRTGVSVENLSKFQLAIELGDTTTEAFARSLNKLSINIAKNQESFAALGINAKDPLEAFIQLADVFSSIEDPQTRAAFLAKALGKSYAEMAPLLRMGADELRRLGAEGEALTGVTAEQARMAGEFNDQLSVLSKSLQGLQVQFGLGIIGPLVAIGVELDKKIKKFGVFNGLIDAYNTGVKNFTFGGNIGLSDDLDKINLAIAEAKRVREDISKRQRFIFKDLGAEIDRKDTEKQNEIILNLERQREAEIERIRASRKKSEPETNVNKADIEKFIGGENKAGKATESRAESTKKLVSAEKTRYDAFQKTIEQLRFEAEISEESAENQRLLLEIRSLTAGATASQSSEIENLIRLKYEEAEINEILAEGERLALDQRREMQAQIKSQTEAYKELLGTIENGQSGPLSAGDQQLNSGLATAQDALKLGIINEEEFKATTAKLVEYSQSMTDDITDNFSSMSVFADQAARNMQDAFADFLFDPFAEGTKGMVDGFLTSIKRMTAEIASSALFDALKPVAQAGLSAAGSGISSLFGFENGGIMTGNGPVQLRKYASGGIANEPQLALYGEGSMAEAFVPLPDGRSIPVKMEGGAGKSVIVNNYFTIGNNVSRQSQDQIAASAGRGIQQALLRAQ